MTREELASLLGGRTFGVFGTGFTAGMLLQGLRERGLEEGLRVFVVSDPAAASGRFQGKPVVPLSVYASEVREQLSAGSDNADSALLLAVHDAILPEVRELIKLAGLPETFPAVPAGSFLPELLYGKPERMECSVGRLLAGQDPDEYWTAVRYAAVLCHAGELPEGEMIYRKAMRLFTGAATTEKRYAACRALLQSVRREGFRQDCPVRIDASGRIIDGLHRLAVCRFLGIGRVPAEVYPVSPVFDRIFGSRNRVPASEFGNAGFTDREISILKGIKASERMMRGEMSPEGTAETPRISVILPVYNVEDYLDRCLRSVTEQSFPDLEIILVNDGSTDGSGEKLRAWKERDRRIRLFETENRGVSPARNLGIEEARGEYIMFADPDDWLDRIMAEKLLLKAEETGADFTECDLWRVDGRTGKMILRHLNGVMGVPWTRREHMIYGATATYKSLNKRTLWTENGVKLPDCSFESPAVYALLLALSNRVVNVPEPLYYYRRFRENSLVETGYADRNGNPDPELGVGAMRHLLSEFRRTGLYGTYRDTLERVVKYRLSDILAMQFHRRDGAEFREIASAMRRFLSETWQERNETAMIFGGYNLNRIVLHLPLLEDPSLRFNFSSIAAVMSGAECTDGSGAPGSGASESAGGPFRHKNRYRELMLNREWGGTFRKLLAAAKPELLFLDLLEERHGLLCLKNTENPGEMRIVTMSDAYAGAEQVPMEINGSGGAFLMERADRNSGLDTLMGQAMESFLRFVHRVSPKTRIVVVESILCGTVGTLSDKEPYPEQERIIETNRILRSYYDRLRSFCEELERGYPEERKTVFIPVEEGPLFFTDRGYEYGAVPEHWNERMNREIARRIEEQLFPGRDGAGL